MAPDADAAAGEPSQGLGGATAGARSLKSCLPDKRQRWFEFDGGGWRTLQTLATNANSILFRL